MSLPRTEEHLIHDHVKFRVGRIVYAAVSPDETIMGFGFPREERAALIAAEPAKFCLPRLSDQRYNWVHARMAAVDPAEMRELLADAWRMVVPKRLAAAHLGDVAGHHDRAGGGRDSAARLAGPACTAGGTAPGSARPGRDDVGRTRPVPGTWRRSQPGGNDGKVTR
jgi:hypothetical protein